jgi:hypothetical protein
MTTQKVSAVLRKAGYTAAQRHTTRVRGWYHWTPGFVVRRCGEAGVRVEHHNRDHERDPEGTAAALAGYKESLLAVGMRVLEGDSLLVVVPTAPEAPK